MIDEIDNLPRLRDPRSLSGSFVRAAQLLLKHGSLNEATEAAERSGASRDAVLFLRTKAALTTGTADWGAALAGEGAVGGFVEALRSSSAYVAFAALANEVPLRQRIIAWSGLPVAFERTSEGDPFPVIAGSMEPVTLAPRDVGALIVASKEALDADAAGFEILRRELLRAGAAGVDTEFFATVIADLTAAPADAEDPLPAITTAMAEVIISGGSRPMFFAGVGAARYLSTAQNDLGRIFPEMTPLGGSILGIPVMVSDYIGDPELLLIDGAGWNIAPPAFDVRAGGQGVVRFQGQDAPVSLWQNNLISMRVIGTFGMEALRDNTASLIEFGS